MFRLSHNVCVMKNWTFSATFLVYVTLSVSKWQYRITQKCDNIHSISSKIVGSNRATMVSEKVNCVSERRFWSFLSSFQWFYFLDNWIFLSITPKCDLTIFSMFSSLFFGYIFILILLSWITFLWFYNSAFKTISQAFHEYLIGAEWDCLVYLLEMEWKFSLYLNQ